MPASRTDQSDDVSSGRGQKNVQSQSFSCDWPGCGKAFTRKSDAARHHNSVHQLEKLFWCPVPGCIRSESFSGENRPFPRRDKLVSHMKNIHPTVALDTIGAPSVNRLAGVKEISDMDGSTNSNGSTNINGSTGVNEFINAAEVADGSLGINELGYGNDSTNATDSSDLDEFFYFDRYYSS